MIPEHSRMLHRILFASAWILLILLIPGVTAGNVSNGTDTLNATVTPSEYFITIDPIGNHTVGDVFFINGTTNLPPSRNLTIEIIDAYVNSPPQSKNAIFVFPPGKDISIQFVPIIPDHDGSNRWSVNVTDDVKKLEASAYYVIVWSETNASCYRMDCAGSTPSELPYTAMTAEFSLFPEDTTQINNKITITTPIQSTITNANPQITPEFLPTKIQSSSVSIELFLVILIAVILTVKLVQTKKGD